MGGQKFALRFRVSGLNSQARHSGCEPLRRNCTVEEYDATADAMAIKAILQCVGSQFAKFVLASRHVIWPCAETSYEALALSLTNTAI